MTVISETEIDGFNHQISVYKDGFKYNEAVEEKFQSLHDLMDFDFFSANIDELDFKIIKDLYQSPSLRKALVDSVKMARTTVYDRLKKLQQRKIVEKSTISNGGRGRPRVQWALQEGWDDNLFNLKLFELSKLICGKKRINGIKTDL